MKNKEQTKYDESKIKDLNEIIPCQCEEGSDVTTMVEYYLNGEVFKISCIECDDEYNCNYVGDVVEEWNKIQQAKIKEKSIVSYMD